MLIFEDVFHPLVRKLFLHLKEAILHLKSLLDMPFPGRVRNIGHYIAAKRVTSVLKHVAQIRSKLKKPNNKSVHTL